MATVKFNGEARISLEKGDNDKYYVTVFGGTKPYLRDGNLYKNNKLSKSFKNKSSAIKYQKYLLSKYKIAKKRYDL